MVFTPSQINFTRSVLPALGICPAYWLEHTTLFIPLLGVSMPTSFYESLWRKERNREKHGLIGRLVKIHSHHL